MSMADCKPMPAQSGPLVQYGCGPVQFSGMDNTFYERRLTFDKVIEPSAAKNVTENDTAANDDSTNAPHLILVPRARTRSWVGGDRALLETPGASQLHVADTWLPNVAVLQHDGVVESQTRGHSEWFP